MGAGSGASEFDTWRSPETAVSCNQDAAATCARAATVSYDGSEGIPSTSATPGATPVKLKLAVVAPAGMRTEAGNCATPAGAWNCNARSAAGASESCMLRSSNALAMALFEDPLA